MRYNVQVSENKTKFSCGCSSMVEHQPSKLDTWVRFPSPALVISSKQHILYMKKNKNDVDKVCEIMYDNQVG